MIEPTSEAKDVLRRLKVTAKAIRRNEGTLDVLRKRRDDELLEAVEHVSNVKAAEAADVTEGYVRKVRSR